MSEKKNLGLRRIFMRTFAYDNIVLTQALGLCPIIAAGVSGYLYGRWKRQRAE